MKKFGFSRDVHISNWVFLQWSRDHGHHVARIFHPDAAVYRASDVIWCVQLLLTHISPPDCPLISVFFLASCLPPASLYGLIFAGLDHYSCRSLSPREAIYSSTAKRCVFPPPFPPKATLTPSWNTASEFMMGELELLLYKGLWQWRCGLLYKIQSMRVRDTAAACECTVVRLPSCILEVFCENKQWEKQHEWKYSACVPLLSFMPGANS